MQKDTCYSGINGFQSLKIDDDNSPSDRCGIFFPRCASDFNSTILVVSGVSVWLSSAIFYTYLAANLLRLEVLQITEDLASLTTQLPFRTWFGRLNLVRQNLKARLFFNYLLEHRLNF